MSDATPRRWTDDREDTPPSPTRPAGGGWRDDPGMPGHLREALLELAERQEEQIRVSVGIAGAVRGLREETAALAGVVARVDARIEEVHGLALATAARVGRLDKEAELGREDLRRGLRDLAQVRAQSSAPRERVPSLHDIDEMAETTAVRAARKALAAQRRGRWGARQWATLITAIAAGVAAIVAAAAKVFGGK